MEQCLLRKRIDLFRETRLFAGRVVFVVNMVRGGLVNGLAGCGEESRRFFRVSGGNGVEHFAGRFLDARLLGHVLRMTLRIGLDTQNRRFDIRQNFHPPFQISLPMYFITRILKKQLLFLRYSLRAVIPVYFTPRPFPETWISKSTAKFCDRFFVRFLNAIRLIKCNHAFFSFFFASLVARRRI